MFSHLLVKCDLILVGAASVYMSVKAEIFVCLTFYTLSSIKKYKADL